MENIYARLANGESSDAIAAEFTAALNEAMARHAKDEEEKAAKAEAERLAKAEAEARHAHKRFDMVDLLDDTFHYLAKHYPAFGIEDGDWDEEELAAIADLLILTLDLEVMKAASKPRVTVKATKTGDKKILTTDEAFADFFRQFNL